MPFHKRNKVKVNVRRFLVQVYDCVEHPQLRISFLKTLHEIGQSLCCYYRLCRPTAGVLVIADLKNDLVKRFLLFAAFYVLIIVFDTSVFPRLPRIVLDESLIKKFVIDLFNIVLHQNDILIGAGSINVICDEFSVIVTYASFPEASADSSLYVITLLPNVSAIRRKKLFLGFIGVSTHAFVTFAKVTQRCFCHS